MKKIFTSVLLSIAALSADAATFGGPYTIPSGTYPTLAAFLNDFNTNCTGITANITVNINVDETAPAGGWVLGSATTNPLSGPFSLTINGKDHIFTAPSGTGSHDAIFTVLGYNNVTIQNMNLVESSANTTNTSLMEHGFSIVKRINNDGSKTVSIIDCEITLNKLNTTAASGVSHLGSAGVFIGNCTYGSTSALAPTLEDGTNDGIFLLRDSVHNCNYGVFANGNPVAADGSAFNDKNITMAVCRITDFTHDGIYLSYHNNESIGKCYINNMADGGTAPTTNHLFGIRYVNPNTAINTHTNWTCTENNIDLTIACSGTYAATGIYTQLFGTGATDINKDTVKLTATGSSAQLVGIFSQNKGGNQFIKSNVVQDFTTLTTNSQTVDGIFSGGYAASANFSGLGLTNTTVYPDNSEVDNNTVQSFNVSSGTRWIIGIEDVHFTINPTKITNNKILKLTANANSALLAGHSGLSISGTAVNRTTTISGNQIDGLSVSASTNTATVVGFYPVGTYASGGSTGNTINFSKNKISNLSAGAGTAMAYRLEYCLGATINQDTVDNITSAAGNVFGVLSGNTAYSPYNVTINKCKFSNLKCNSTTGGWSAIGVWPGAGSTQALTTFNLTGNLFQNVISTDPSGLAIGLYISGGNATYNISNNILYDVAAASNTANYSSSMGMYLVNTGTNNVYYNTVNLATASASGYGGTGILYNVGATNKLQNNILRIDVNAGATNNTAAMRASSGIAKTPPSGSAFGAASNIYYAPKGTNNYLYAEGGASVVNGYAQSGLTQDATKNIVNDTFFNSECNRSSYHKFMQTASATREKNTFTENNLVASAGTYAPTGISLAESRAADVSVALDFFTTARPFGSSDIGAIEFSGSTLPQMTINITSTTGFDTACNTNLPSLVATHPSYFNKVSYQWYLDTSSNPIPGATKLTVPVGVAGGKYYLYIYDSVTGCTYKSNAFKMVVVPPPPAMITYYDSLTFCQSSAVVVQANKGYMYTYKWKRNGSYLAGETKDHLVIDKSGVYEVEINTPLGCPSTSKPIVVKVYPLPNPVVYWVRDRVLGVTQKFYTYQWYRNNVLIPGPDATNALYYVLDDAAYSVEVTDSNGCSAKSEVFLYSLGVTESNVAAEVKVYPNPASDVLNVMAPAGVKVSLSDVTGRTFIEKTNEKVLDMSRLAEGMYLLNIFDRDDKLIKVEKVNRVR
jgi:hypothetical protein